MAKTVLASKEIKCFSAKNCLFVFRMFDAPFAWFFKNFFMRNRPAYTSNWNSENKKPDDLNCDIHMLLHFLKPI